jgi:DNA-binding winged helix-turn-helix (wHTH) protein
MMPKLMEREGRAMARYQIEDLILDADRRRLRRDGRWLAISERSLAVLLVLIDAGPEGSSFAELMQGAWSGAVVGEDTVKKRISLLRQEIGDRSDTQLIQSLRGRGYRIAVPVERVEAPRPGPSRFNRRAIGGVATAASVFIAGAVMIDPAAGLGHQRCGEVGSGPLVSEILVVADDRLGEHRQILRSQVGRALTDSVQLDRSGPYQMSARLMLEHDEPVLELSLRCGDATSEEGAEAWVMRYSVDPERPADTQEAVDDLLARVRDPANA